MAMILRNLFCWVLNAVNQHGLAVLVCVYIVWMISIIGKESRG